jgi:hypothetical protein
MVRPFLQDRLDHAVLRPVGHQRIDRADRVAVAIGVVEHEPAGAGIAVLALAPGHLLADTM